jgi:hypothetical protein
MKTAGAIRLFFIYLVQIKSAALDFGYGVAKMVIFENRSGMYPCIIPSSFDEG